MESNKAEEYFYGFQNHFMDFGLDNLKKFMRELGDPQEKIRIIHIAGTNGKGSVSAYMSAILEQSGCGWEDTIHRQFLKNWKTSA